MAKAKAQAKDVSLIVCDVYGIVKWFHKGQGRITIKDYGEVFVHFRQISKPAPKCYAPQKFLIKGQTVKCNLLSGPKGVQASKVVVVIDVTSDKDDKQSVTSDSTCLDYCDDLSSSDSDEEPVKSPPRNVLEKDLRGEVVSFNETRAFGFIKTHQYGNIFCHLTDVISAGAAKQKKLTPSQFVKCDVARGPKGLMALNVHVICEASSSTVEQKKHHDQSASRQPKKKEEPQNVSKPAVKGEPPSKGKKKSKKSNEASANPIKAEVKNTGDAVSSEIQNSDVLGEVLHYNSIKNFGFIKVPLHDSVYVHKSGLVDCDKLVAKQVVKFDIVKGPKSLMAINLKIISDAPAFGEAVKPQIVEDKTKSEPKTDESKGKKKKKSKKEESQDPPPLMSQVLSSAHPSSKKQAPPTQPPSAPPAPPFLAGPPPFAPNYPYPQPPQNPYMSYPNFGPQPPPYMQPPPPPHMHQPPLAPPPYPGQVPYLPHMLHDTHISSKATSDPCAKPQDPKASSEQKIREGVSKELICGICEDLLEDPVITPCDHLFCRGCLLEWLPYNGQCPIDREPLSKQTMKDAPKVIQNLCRT